ncbi:hypothetical protein B1R32_103230 [Abditibacterium utsteinense]|uniref:Uncharacterized protein n=2 Tax=Abditibacterium utsteinense TaxID=1960156 RepID=A0A2S8SVZ3_9BACT|nr:hypothetical protein B1R32_103230 [Abditibacterium utsteinense]
MCWACYTPLTAGASLGAGMAGGPAAVTAMPNSPASRPINVPGSAEEPQKKSIDPKIIGVGAFLIVAGLAAFLMSGAMGGNSTGETTGGTDPTPNTIMERPPSGPSGPSALLPSLGNPGGNPGGAPPAPVALPFTTITPPNPQFETGTMGILVATNVSPTQAAGFARFARDQNSRGKWTKMQICVFTNKTAADAFASYQKGRRGAPLTNNDFAQLASNGVWNGAPAFLESRGKQERIFSPAQSPNAWWQRR